VRTDVLAGFRPAAVALWLQGEREYRRAEFEAALGRFQAAVAVDSTMALAAVRGAQAAGWILRPTVVQDLLAVGLRNEAALSTKHRHLARGLGLYYAGDADGARDQFLAALTVDPTLADAHMALGETYHHLLPGLSDPGGDAEAAFRQALRYDPGFTPAMVHLAELALYRGDTDVAERYAAEVEADHGPVAAADHLALVQACIDGGPGAVQWEDEVSASPSAVLEAAVASGVGGRRSRCAVAGYSALVEAGPTDYAWSALLGLQSHLVAVGGTDDARSAIEGAEQFSRQRPYLFILDALAGAPFEREAEAGALGLEREGDPSSSTRLWAVGAWQATRGRPDRVAAVLEAARELAAGPGATRADSLLVNVLGAWNALARNDTSEAIARLETLAPVGTALNLAWGVWEGLGAERMLLARLYLDRQEFGRAIEVAESLDHPQPITFLAYLPGSLRIRASAAEALGQERAAAAYRERLDQLRGDLSTPLAGGTSPRDRDAMTGDSLSRLAPPDRRSDRTQLQR
jgi:tetratricopeptide (TPR) repeat protein